MAKRKRSGPWVCAWANSPYAAVTGGWGWAIYGGQFYPTPDLARKAGERALKLLKEAKRGRSKA